MPTADGHGHDADAIERGKGEKRMKGEERGREEKRREEKRRISCHKEPHTFKKQIRLHNDEKVTDSVILSACGGYLG